MGSAIVTHLPLQPTVSLVCVKSIICQLYYNSRVKRDLTRMSSFLTAQFPFQSFTHTHTLTQKETLFKFDNPQNWIVSTFSSLSCVFSISLLLLLFFSSFLSSFLSSFIYWRDFFSTCNISTLLLWLLYIYILQKLYHYSARSLFPLPSFRKFLFPVVFKYIKKKEEKWV